MIIHNFFSDVLLSLLDLFENYIFQNKTYWYYTVLDNSAPYSFFRNVQFNIGNRNYQIGNYKNSAQLEFPTGLFSFNGDETAYGKMGNLIAHHRIYDVNEILCTHNEDTNVDIILREEQSVLNLSVQINCESMQHANEVVHQIKRFLPINKYCQLVPFKSFLQIPNFFFHNKYNNPDKHNIKNLFLKYDNTTGELNYFFMICYKPMIQLNSATADLSDNSARSFSVVCDFNYLIQMPMWLFDTYLPENISRIDLSFGSSENSDISSILTDVYTALKLYTSPIKINDCYYSTIEKYVVDYTSETFKDNRIVIPEPQDDDYFIKIVKYIPFKSTVVHIIPRFNFIDNKYNTTLFEDNVNILKQDDFAIIDKRLIIFTKGNIDLIPELNKPIIVSVMKKSKTVRNNNEKKKRIINIYKSKQKSRKQYDFSHEYFK